MSKIINEHECDHLPEKGVYIEFSGDGEMAWLS